MSAGVVASDVKFHDISSRYKLHDFLTMTPRHALKFSKIVSVQFMQK